MSEKTVTIPELDALLLEPPRSGFWTEAMDDVLRKYYPPLAARYRSADLLPHLARLAGRTVTLSALRSRVDSLGLRGKEAINERVPEDREPVRP